ncbi:MAG TPA: helix-turn-helix transcriptional regulator [Gemmataceae bacterium]|jgi:transcriptional regulator with XRE-family HTH domain|nr:helix-turn-helix transcriptional regulator [Gemmataceae bacterium]
MNGQISAKNADLVAKIARLVEQRGWNQEDFCRQAGLNRQTVRRILQRDSRLLRNVTVNRCARALGLDVDDLRDVPLGELLARIQRPPGNDADGALRGLYEHAMQPELHGWLERNPERARQLAPAEVDELLSLQGTGGPLTRTGVEHFVALIERRRTLVQQVLAVAGTEYLDVLEKVVALMYEKIQPYRDKD